VIVEEGEPRMKSRNIYRTNSSRIGDGGEGSQPRQRKYVREFEDARGARKKRGWLMGLTSGF